MKNKVTFFNFCKMAELDKKNVHCLTKYMPRSFEMQFQAFLGSKGEGTSVACKQCSFVRGLLVYLKIHLPSTRIFTLITGISYSLMLGFNVDFEILFGEAWIVAIVTTEADPAVLRVLMSGVYIWLMKFTKLNGL